MAIINFCGYQTGALANAKTEGALKPNAEPITPVKNAGTRGKPVLQGTAPEGGQGHLQRGGLHRTQVQHNEAGACDRTRGEKPAKRQVV